MPKKIKKSSALAILIGIITVLILGPLDEALLLGYFGVNFLNLPLTTALFLGFVVGLTVYICLNKR